MKFRFKKPSPKKSLKAKTTGKLKRKAKKAVNPLYGRKGVGLVKDPKKSLYNKVYKKTSDGIKDIINSKQDGNNSNNAEMNSGSNINLSDYINIRIESGPVGQSTGSTETDFYVYEWFIEDTGEIFYVGKGRGDRYKEYHERAYEAEKIREMYDTDVRFVGKKLNEDEAIYLESKEMTRILNETDYILTNVITPTLTKRDSGYSKSPNTPAYEFETAPILYSTIIEEHYYGVKGKPFDKVVYENLSRPVFIDKNISREELKIVYGGEYEKYLKEVISLLEANENKVLKTKYAKSASAWIYSSDDLVSNNDIDQKNALERIGRNIPSYHLIDVWKLLKDEYSNVEIEKPKPIEIHPVNNRVHLSQTRNRNNWEKGFDEGYKYWEQGDKERKAGNIEEALKLFDKARYNGYFAPVLYNSYAMAYRKLKDLDNEIDILNEGIERYRGTTEDNTIIIVELEEQKKKAIIKLQKANNS